MKKKICVISGSRSDYGIFLSFAQVVKTKVKILVYKLFVPICIYPKKFGYTYKEILSDGFAISKKIPLIYKNNDTNEQARAIINFNKKITLCHR